MVTLYNLKQNRGRYGGTYETSKDYFKQWKYKSLEEIQKEQERRLTSFFKYIRSYSEHYQYVIPEKSVYTLNDLANLPIMTKNDIVDNYDKLKTISDKKGLLSYTGGTTGASLKVVYKWEDMQERRAFLDYFWEQYGYKKGARTAWFSGKHIIPDGNSNVLWRKDWVNNIRYYSTFHIAEKNIKYYIENINKFQPQFMVGFPSSVHQIVKSAKEKGLKHTGNVKCFFPTAEALIPGEVAEIKEFFGCEVRDQYASSEGAPFITECPEGNLHYDMLTGIIEVVDKNLKPNQEGEILVTSFTTKGTPLIRYKIGDHIKLSHSNEQCSCGQETPIVVEIQGRANDYILSPDRGKVNLGNLSNCTKGVKGILQFQVIQNTLSDIEVLIVSGDEFSVKQHKLFEKSLRQTLGPSINVEFKNVSSIPREKSGKFRIVKNEIV